MIPLFKVRTNLCGTEIDKVLSSGYTGQGKVVEQLEKELGSRLGTVYPPLTVNSCTSAINLAVQLCGVEPGDEVISTPLTCFASQIGAIHAGARIRWADIDPLTGLIDPKSIAKLTGPKTRAIIGVDWAGRSIDVETLWDNSDYEVPVIEDAAHRWETPEKRGFEGDFVCYSFQSIKFLHSGDGGCLVVNDTIDKHKRAKLLRWYGMDREAGDRLRCMNDVVEAGHKYHMNDLTATLAMSNLDLAEDSVRLHKRNAATLDRGLGDLTTIRTPPPDPDCSYWLYSLLVEKGTKEQFIEHLKSKGIEASPVHIRNDNYTCTRKFKEQRLPGVDEFSLKQVSIPVGWYLTDNDLDHIIHTVRSY